ncbi:MAG TPA: hypothetical protein VNR11_16660 [Xanthobacteraceae bacterium]|nr:hypothetical protein [Xanthobacteraceae bacterium]
MAPTMHPHQNRPEMAAGAISPRPATQAAQKNKNRTESRRSPGKRLSAADLADLADLRRIRQEAEAEIERLLDLLDQIEGDPDLEPSLASPEMPDFVMSSFLTYGDPAEFSQERWAKGGADDREDEHDGREPDEADNEPSLGAPECHPRPAYACERLGDGEYRESSGDQSNWNAGFANDCEDEFDGREPDEDFEPEEREADSADDEPNLGWNDEEAARGSYANSFGRGVDPARVV